jgi:hypothetical protein
VLTLKEHQGRKDWGEKVKYFLKSSGQESISLYQISTDNQHFSKIKHRAVFDLNDMVEDGEVPWRT